MNTFNSKNNCSVCNSILEKFITLYDDRYGYPGYFKLFKCTNCGHKILDGDFSSELLSKLYTEYYPRSSFKLEDFKPYEELEGFRAWFNGVYSSPFRWVPKNVRILDIGCGFGESLGYHKSRDCDVYGVEADENIRRVADKFGFKVHVGLFDPDAYKPDFFDYITMAQVIEHVTDPITTLKGVARILKPGGIAILSTPNSNGWGARVFGRKWINWHVPYHLQHFSVESMKIATEKAGIVIKEYKTITSSEWLYYQWIHLVTYPKMGSPSAFWTKKAALTYPQYILLSMLMIIHKSKFNHVMTRLFDGMRFGDNFIFILSKPSLS